MFDSEVKARNERSLGFVNTPNRWYGGVRRLPRPALTALVKMGAMVGR